VEICLTGSFGTSASFPKIFTGLSSKITPERRLLGMFHHFYHVANEGLLKLWLLVLLNLSQYADEKVLCRQALSEIEILSSTPDW
jgi:hypothetical protein